MASKNQQPEETTKLDMVNDELTNMSHRIATNKKAIWVAFAAIVVVACATLGYIYFYRAPRLEKAYNAYNKVEITTMGNDSLAAAEYKKVADEYGNTSAGNVARLSAAESYYNIKKYNEAAAMLEDFKTDDYVLNASSKLLLGDCYVNLKKYDKAISAYTEAERAADGNPGITPRILLKKANVYDAQKNYAEALKCYETLDKDFPQFQPGNGVPVEAYIEREKARLGK